MESSGESWFVEIDASKGVSSASHLYVRNKLLRVCIDFIIGDNKWMNSKKRRGDIKALKAFKVAVLTYRQLQITLPVLLSLFIW